LQPFFAPSPTHAKIPTSFMKVCLGWVMVQKNVGECQNAYNLPQAHVHSHIHTHTHGYEHM